VTEQITFGRYHTQQVVPNVAGQGMVNPMTGLQRRT